MQRPPTIRILRLVRLRLLRILLHLPRLRLRIRALPTTAPAAMPEAPHKVSRRILRQLRPVAARLQRRAKILRRQLRAITASRPIQVSPLLPANRRTIITAVLRQVSSSPHRRILLRSRVKPTAPLLLLPHPADQNQVAHAIPAVVEALRVRASRFFSPGGKAALQKQ